MTFNTAKDLCIPILEELALLEADPPMVSGKWYCYFTVVFNLLGGATYGFMDV